MIEIPLKSIRLQSDQPRRTIDPCDIRAMMASLSTTGQMQPILVRHQVNRGYVLVFGYLRFHAARNLGWETISAIAVPAYGDSRLLDLALWVNHNLHHSAPKLDELAVAVSRFSDAGMGLMEITEALGKPQPWVKSMLEIARDPLARQLIDSGRLEDVEAWQSFRQLLPPSRKAVLDSNEPISVQRCLLCSEADIPI